LLTGVFGMRVQVGTAQVNSVELEGGHLRVHLGDERQIPLLENVQDFSVVRCGDELHIVAFDQDGGAWHFQGNESYVSHRLDLEQGYGGGSRLVTDDTGQLHLVYLTQPIKGQGAALRHQIFSGEWSKPMVVTTHVRPDRWGFSICWEPTAFLHLVYASHGDGHLFYRVYAAPQKSWSGAVPLVQKPCHHPQFFPIGQLALAWIVEEMSGQVQLMQKEETWSSARTVSRPPAPCSGLGWGLIGSEPYLFWRQGEKLWQLRTSQPGEPFEALSAGYDFTMQVIVDQRGGSLTVPIYTPRPRPRSEAEQAAAPPSPPAVEQRDPAAEKLQAALIEQAFKMQMEGEKLRQEYEGVRRLLASLEEQVRAEMKSLSEKIANIPKPKLEPLTQRVERLEIRLTKHDRELHAWQAAIENRLGKFEQASLAMNRRIGALENPESEPRPSLWQRLWRW
jgi:hypothetical protein